MKYHDKYLQLREELWREFEALVRRGATFPELLDVTYPSSHPAELRPQGLPVDSEGNPWFYARALERNPQYNLHWGEDLIVGTSKVIFIASDGQRHEIEPDILDLYWLSALLDSATRG